MWEAMDDKRGTEFHFRSISQSVKRTHAAQLLQGGLRMLADNVDCLHERSLVFTIEGLALPFPFLPPLSLRSRSPPLVPVSAIVSRQHLRSAQQNTRYRLTTYGRRAFSVAGPTAWNSLPVAFIDPKISDACFRRHLKTVLFAQQRRHQCLARARFYMITRSINSHYITLHGVAQW